MLTVFIYRYIFIITNIFYSIKIVSLRQIILIIFISIYKTSLVSYYTVKVTSQENYITSEKFAQLETKSVQNITFIAFCITWIFRTVRGTRYADVHISWRMIPFDTLSHTMFSKDLSKIVIILFDCNFSTAIDIYYVDFHISWRMGPFVTLSHIMFSKDCPCFPRYLSFYLILFL